jgi:hypothetical protein
MIGLNLRRLRRRVGCLGLLMIFLGIANQACGQTASTGSLTGVATDPSGAVLAGVTLHLARIDGSETRSAISDKTGRFAFLLLPPGSYELQAAIDGFDTIINTNLTISVTETTDLDLRFRLATVVHQVQVSANPQMAQTDTSALGRVVDEQGVTGLPLVTRNFSQIASLSPGVESGVNNAGELGLGGNAQSQIASSNDGIFVHGARSYDNNYELDGISVNDVQGSASGSGGIPAPSPDSIQEFKVQTGLYDAGYGRYGGANVSLVTKIGGDAFHGTAFEFLRNDALNANDFFLHQTGQPRPALSQNQFGFTTGGPIRKDKLFFFASYQGTRQIDGLAAGQSRVACTASLTEPPLTNDRSAAALGQMFAGMTGANGGTAIKSDGSNINPVALALLNFKLPDGDFLIPTPQLVHSTRPLVQQGSSVFSRPCHFSENQFSAGVDYQQTSKSKFAGRFFFANDNDTVTFPGNGANPSGNIPGFLSPSNVGFRVFSIAHTYTFSDSLLNEARFGYVRTSADNDAITPFHWSDIGVAEGEMNQENELPSLKILGSVSMASGFPRTFEQNSYVFTDNLILVHGAHTLKVGGSLTRLQDNLNLEGLGTLLEFLSWPDFLLGMNAASNGSSFSNVFQSLDVFGLTVREFRVWEGAGFLQDDFRVSRSLTLNLGVRYEHLGQFGDRLGRNSSFDIRAADPNPPPVGSVAGYIVASNYPGILPSGVRQVGNTFGNFGAGQNTFSPRLGFAWQILPSSGRLVLRAGYGTYYSRPTGQAFYQSVFGAPFSEFRINTGQANANATFEFPFAQPFPTSASFPMFPPYSPTSTSTIYTVAPGFRPALIQQYSLNIQTEFHTGWLLDVGYVGTRGTHLVRQRSLNQALSASTDDPIRTITDNTVNNISSRVPILGIPPDSLLEMESEGNSWYNALEASLTKRLSHGFQFLASYTFSKILDTDGADTNSTSSGNGLTLGDQNSSSQRWGRASFDRTHRFVFSGIWALPSPPGGVMGSILGHWSVAAIVIVQSGTALTIGDTNSNNVFGISEDRAELSGLCSKHQLTEGGSIESKLNGYFDKECFANPAVIGADGIGTAFGNSSTGIVDGPGQANLDEAISKMVPLDRLVEGSALEFRTELFNALNHPQFGNPDTNFTSPTFGVISNTAVNPRVIQFALKFSF